MRFSEAELLSRVPFADAHPLLVDVGAHHGSFSRPFVARGWRVLAFEPETENRHRFEEQLGADPNVTCLPYAVSDRHGERTTFFVSDEHYGIHSLTPWHSTHHAAYEVQTVRLDAILAERGSPHVNLLKIDTEGADLSVLKGFDWSADRPDVVLAEFMDERTEPHFRYTHHDMVQLMEANGYLAFVSAWSPVVQYAREGVQQRGPRWLECSPYPLEPVPQWGNVIFVRPDRYRVFITTLRRYRRGLWWKRRAAPLRRLARWVPGIARIWRTILRRR